MREKNRVDVAVEAVRFLMVDPVHREPAMKLVPCPRFVGIDRSAAGDPGTNEIQRRDF
jgi:hypothetical protein